MCVSLAVLRQRKFEELEPQQLGDDLGGSALMSVARDGGEGRPELNAE